MERATMKIKPGNMILIALDEDGNQHGLRRVLEVRDGGRLLIDDRLYGGASPTRTVIDREEVIEALPSWR